MDKNEQNRHVSDRVVIESDIIYPKTIISKAELLKGIDDSFQQENTIPEVESIEKSKKKSKFNESDPLIIKIENFISERYGLRMDEVRNVLEVRKKWLDEPFKKDERFESNITVELMREGFKHVKTIVGALLSSDFVKSYHPVRDYFENLEQWDGEDRYSKLVECLVTTNIEHQILLKDHLKKHLFRCIASVFIPGFFK